MNRAIFLDRDGVINEAIVVDNKPYPPNTIDDVYIFPEMKDMLRMFNKMGYINIIITNQPDVAKGKQTRENVEAINNIIKWNLSIDDVFTCYHSDEDNCNCRKPKIGSFLMAKEKYNLDLRKSWMIGDRWSDIEAGYAAGCSTIFIDRGYKEKQSFRNDFCVVDIKEIMEIINANKDLR